VTASSFALRGPGGLVPASITYNAATSTAVLNPAAPLAHSTTYTATVYGGSPGMKDAAGNPLDGDRSWSFRTVADTTPPTVTTVTPPPGATNVARTVDVVAVFSKALDPATVTSAAFELRGPSGVVAAAISYDSSTSTAVLNPHATLAFDATYTATVYGGPAGVKDAAGNPLASNRTWSFTTERDLSAPVLSWRSPDSGALGVSIGASVVVRFDKAMAANWVNAATITLRSAAGVVPAAVYYDRATYTATLKPVVPLSFFTIYTVAVVGGVGGVRTTTGVSLQAHAAWAFMTQPDTTPPVVVETEPAAWGTGLPVDSALKVRFSKPMNPASINASSFELHGPQGRVAAVVTYDAATAVAGLKPAAPLLGSTRYVAVVKGSAGGMTDMAGNALIVSVIWSFTTSAAAPNPPRAFSLFSDVTPAGVDPDRVPIEVGLKFRSQVDGHIAGIRFYKYPSNTGVHLGSLWTSTGTKLAGVRFTNETASGWQEARFASPVPITAGVTYVASYFTTAGRYAVTENYFTHNGRTRGPLVIDPSGTRGPSRYVYSATSRFPTATYRASNYFVDVVFVASN
jgi:hypothetical protein